MNFFETACFYQIYPLGLLGAPWDNDPAYAPVSRLPSLVEWIPHVTRLGLDAIYLCPIFESTHHGYDTKDFMATDRRLGTNQDLAVFISACHKSGIKIIIDGVFNHVGREFWAFQDVLQKRESSAFAGWFHIDFSGDSTYNDGFWYEGWEGHYGLVKLNLSNHEVKEHIFEAVEMWINELGIDGLRLDVAYLLPKNFLRELSGFCRAKKPDFWIVGEALHGDYRDLMDGGQIDSVTNYECYKGLHSSFNSSNMFEIAYSLNRQFGAEQWTLYKGRHLFNFVDNHDVSRIATILNRQEHLPLIYTLLFTMPGVPCVYYGSEWGIQGDKKDGDHALRPYIETPEWNWLTEHVARLSGIRRVNRSLTHGSYQQLLLSNSQYIFERAIDGQRIIVAINISSDEFTAHFNANAGCGVDLLTWEKIDFGGGLLIKPYSALIIGKLQ